MAPCKLVCGYQYLEEYNAIRMITDTEIWDFTVLVWCCLCSSGLLSGVNRMFIPTFKRNVKP